MRRVWQSVVTPTITVSAEAASGIVAALVALGYLVRMGRILQRLDQLTGDVAKLVLAMETAQRERADFHSELTSIKAVCAARHSEAA